MKRFYIYLGLLFFPIMLLAQDYGQLVNGYYQGYENRNVKQMNDNANDLIKHYRDDYAGYLCKGYFHLCRGQNQQAEQQFRAMIQLNPFDAGVYSLMALHHYIMGRTQEAEKYLHWSFQLNPSKLLSDVVKDAEVVKEMATRYDLDGFIALAKKTAENYDPSDQSGAMFAYCLQQVTSGQPCNELEQAIGKLNTFKPHNPLWEILGSYMNAYKDYMAYEPRKAIEGFDYFLKQSEPYKSELHYLRAVANFGKSYINSNEYKPNVALVNINRALEEIRKLPVPTLSEAQFLYSKLNYEITLDQLDAHQQTGYNLLSVANKIDSDYYRALANNIIGRNLLNSVIPADQTKGTEMIYTALQIAQKIGDSDLEATVLGNYMVALWQRGRVSEIRPVYNKVYNAHIANKEYIKAEVTASNMGFLMYYEKQYAEASTYFRQAVDLTNEISKTLTPQQKMTLMNNNSEAYNGLVMCYQKLGKTAELFEIQDRNRSRFLKERLQPNAPHATLKEAQAMLGPDDLLLYYTLAGPGEVIINAITQTSAKVYHSYPIDRWIGMKKQYTDRAKKVPPAYNSFMQGYTNDIVDGNFVVYKDKEQNFNGNDFQTQVDWTRQLLQSPDDKLTSVRNAFLKQWYIATLQPLESLLNTKKNLIISASNELNYLPFEAFMKPNGQYLIETHNVRYIPSVSVWKSLKNRNYSENRKPALVMGGATYQPSGNVQGTARGIDDFFAISESIGKKIERNNFNFKEELEKVGFGGASYLPGTLDEVLFVGELDPNIKVVTGKDMTESYLKRLNASEELKKYKIFMISSHGFTTDIIPEFSGIMMSQPNGGDGKEDTFLLAPEIADLKLETDLAILSACDTGLGALVGGEGINGLNSAFLVAGANNTLLSLWPVNDSSTALMMKNLFSMMLIDGMDSSTAINTIKRAMAQGEAGAELTKPIYWAPFLLSGR